MTWTDAYGKKAGVFVCNSDNICWHICNLALNLQWVQGILKRRHRLGHDSTAVAWNRKTNTLRTSKVKTGKTCNVCLKG